MSLILEALKKSEAERRAGEVPVLLGERAFMPRRERPIWPVFAAFVVFVGLAAGYANRSILWPERFPPKPDGETAEVPTALPEGSMAIATEPPATTARKPADLTAAEPVAPVPASTAPAEPPPDMLPEPPATFSPPPAPVAEAAPPPAPPVAAPAPPNASDPPPTYGTPPVGQDPPVIDPVEPAPAPATAAPEPLPVPAIATGTSVPTQAPSEPPAPAPVHDLPLLGDLPYATRQGMPALKVSMQVYHQDPGRRFIIVNGARLQEGGVVGTETWLREIRPNGVVFEFRGERFLLPRQGG